MDRDVRANEALARSSVEVVCKQVAHNLAVCFRSIADRCPRNDASYTFIREFFSCLHSDGKHNRSRKRYQ